MVYAAQLFKLLDIFENGLDRLFVDTTNHIHAITISTEDEPTRRIGADVLAGMSEVLTCTYAGPLYATCRCMCQYITPVLSGYVEVTIESQVVINLSDNLRFHTTLTKDGETIVRVLACMLDTLQLYMLLENDRLYVTDRDVRKFKLSLDHWRTCVV